MYSYNDLKQSALKKYFSRMNPCQQEAVFTVNGAVLILAGAGSGKTTVIVNRIANMVTFGNAYYNDDTQHICSEKDTSFLQDYINGNTDDNERLKNIIAVNSVKPWNILAITFTNKAADELKSRLSEMLGNETASNIHASTFHSACLKILRMEIEKIGYSRNFTIYDSDDSQRVIKSCISDLKISEKEFSLRNIMNEISRAKDNLISPSIYAKQAGNDYKLSVYASVYKEYQNRLELANALDFDDIIMLTVELFEDFPETLEKYQNRYRYIMVDEYQDTNMAQFELIKMLSEKHGNLCVVGDDDQSIYKFRGATIKNILEFENQFADSKVIKLEQNYRSTQNILDAANSIIKNNDERKNKSLWTESCKGEKITVYRAYNEQDEASFIASKVLESVRNGEKFSSNAVLYRMNAQSNNIERAFTANAIPYRVFGGMRFYDRKEIKDILAYLSVINNENDMLRLRRIINEPKRGIGDATVNELENISSSLRCSPLEVMRNASEHKSIAKKSTALSSIARFFDAIHEKMSELKLDELLDIVMEKSGYAEYLRTMGEDGANRLENINELKTSMIEYTNRNGENTSLSGFLEEISLYTDMDKFNDDDDKAVLMTIHSAKGLEFDNVFIAGMEEGIFPSVRNSMNEEELEEERRLAYVAVTRARKKLSLIHTAQRMIFGSTNRNSVSRFVSEIDKNLIENTGNIRKSAENINPPKPPAITIQQQMYKKSIIESGIKKTETYSKPAEKFAIGDRIKHNVFGEGTVIKITEMPGDSMLEVDFEKSGIKRIMTRYNKIKKL
jgi:DNA helicase-2/ATP-dependent DNA helicase PcrA